jgi:hypothetical protein
MFFEPGDIIAHSSGNIFRLVVASGAGNYVYLQLYVPSVPGEVFESRIYTSTDHPSRKVWFLEQSSREAK